MQILAIHITDYTGKGDYSCRVTIATSQGSEVSFDCAAELGPEIKSLITNAAEKAVRNTLSNLSETV